MKKYTCILAFLITAIIGVQPVFAETDYTIVRSLGLPVLDIYTINNEEPTCDFVFAPEGAFGIGTTNKNKVPGRVVLREKKTVIFDSGDYLKDQSGMTIKIRGNTSAYYSSKKPYKIKLEKKNDMLGRQDSMYYDKNWILIDSGGDELKAMIGLKMNEIMGLGHWTPAYTFVNLFINNNYRGVYMLLESIKRNKDCRLDVDKQTGYIFECDAYWWNEATYFSTLSNRKFTFKYPDEEDITQEQIDYITEVVNDMETAINNGTYPEYIDTTSFASWILAHDILGTNDSGGSNIYLTKYDNTPESKITMSTLWDFGSIMQSNNRFSRIHTDSFFYYGELFNSSNTSFSELYRSLWKQKGNIIIDSLIAFLTDFSTSETASAINQSRPYDTLRWNYEGSTVQQNIDEAINWLSDRKVWMNDTTNNISEIKYHTTDSKVYNLTGNTVKGATYKKGIYIKNKKKFVIK